MDSEPEMNILLVAELFYPYGGAELSLWKLCAALTQKGHNIQVVTARRDTEAAHEVKDGIEIHRPFPTGNILRRFIFALRLYPYLNSWLLSRKIDLVYNIGYVPTIPATYAAVRNSIPAVTLLGHICGRDWFRLTNPLSALLNFILEILIIRFGKHSVLVVQCQDSLRRVRPHTSAEIQVLCNTFLEPDSIRETKENTDSKQIRGKLVIGEDELFMLFVGALTRTKNAASLIKVLPEIRTKFKLVLVGDGPEEAKIRKLAAQLGLQDKVLLLGQKPHDETLAIMRASDLLVVSSISEQVPNVVLEALALGKPVIATRVGGIPEIKSANLHLIDDVREISGVLDSGITTEERDKTAEEYSLDKVAEQYETLFQETIRSG